MSAHIQAFKYLQEHYLIDPEYTTTVLDIDPVTAWMEEVILHSEKGLGNIFELHSTKIMSRKTYNELMSCEIGKLNEAFFLNLDYPTDELQDIEDMRLLRSNTYARFEAIFLQRINRQHLN